MARCEKKREISLWFVVVVVVAAAAAVVLFLYI